MHNSDWMRYGGVLERLIAWFRNSGIDFLVNTLLAASLVAAGWLIGRYVWRGLERMLSGKRACNKLRTQMFLNLARVVWWTFILFLVAHCYAFNVVPALAGLGVLGIVVGFGFQEALSSLAAGVMLSLSEPFEVGDEVTIAGFDGTVMWFGYTATRVRTWNFRVVTIPNKQVWGAPIVNHTRIGLRRCDRKVGISYDTDIDRALGVAREALLSMPEVLRDPSPKVWITSLDDSSMALTLQPWCRNENYWTVYNQTCGVIKKAFDRHGIKIPYPQLDVHLSRVSVPQGLSGVSRDAGEGVSAG